MDHSAAWTPDPGDINFTIYVDQFKDIKNHAFSFSLTCEEIKKIFEVLIHLILYDFIGLTLGHENPVPEVMNFRI